MYKVFISRRAHGFTYGEIRFMLKHLFTCKQRDGNSGNTQMIVHDIFM